MARKYIIIATPNFMTVKTGETVNFRLEARNLETADRSFDWQPRWYRINANETTPPGQPLIEKGPVSRSWAIKFEQPGKFIIACMAWRTKPDPSWGALDLLGVQDYGSSPEEKKRVQAAWDSWETDLYPQAVEGDDAFLFDPVLGKTTHTLDPYSVLSALKRYRGVLVQVGAKQFPQPEKLILGFADLYSEHLETVESYTTEIDGLEHRLASTLPAYMGGASQDIWERHPITAVHHLSDPNAQSPDSELKLFLAKRVPAVAGTYRTPESDAGGTAEWKLVDWTNPVDRGRTGEYDGEGKSDYFAVLDALKIWSNYYPWRIGNRYPDGTITYTIPAGVCSAAEINGSFQTTGSTWWDDVDEFLAWVGILSLIVVATITLIAPVPGSQLASIALWAGIAGSIAGAAQGAIHLGESYAEDFKRNWKEEAVDVLSIVGCVVGLRATWARGAVVEGLIGLKAARGIFYGSVAIDGLQGMIIAETQVEQMTSLMNDPSITPDAKIKKLMILFAQLAGQSALVIVNARANAKELAHFNDPQPALPKGPPSETPAQRLKKMADPAATVHAMEVVPAAGHTDDGQHTTIVHDDPYRGPVFEGPPPPPAPPPPKRRTLAEALKDPKAWWEWPLNIKPDRIELNRRVPLSEKQRVNRPLTFRAALRNGYIHVELIRTKTTTGRRVDVRAEDFRADELYPFMFDHFEQTAKQLGTPIIGIHGEFAMDNLLPVENALRNDPSIPHPPPGTSDDAFLASIPQDKVVNALEAAPSWKYWKQYADKHGYTLKPVYARIEPEDDTHIRWLNWSFTLEKP